MLGENDAFLFLYLKERDESEQTDGQNSINYCFLKSQDIKMHLKQIQIRIRIYFT